MHILLTDVLTCPRCGPEFGLIVLADRMNDRQVVEGWLGCANCREEYLVRNGVADLRFPPGGEAEGAAGGGAGEDRAYRIAALLGIGERPGTVLLLGIPEEVAAEVARLLPATQVANAVAEPLSNPTGPSSLSRVEVADSLPFRSGSLRGVVLGGEAAARPLDEALRVLAPGAHLVLDPAPPGIAGALRERGLRVLLEQEGVVVASLSPRR